MFTIKLKNNKLGHVSFENEKCLVNKMFKYRTLGEMVALARANGERPLPTRNGVYTGDLVIPREDVDKIAFREELMKQYTDAEKQLSEANEVIAQEEASKKEAEYKQKVISEYEASKISQ